jgi:hypothetical protein
MLRAIELMASPLADESSQDGAAWAGSVVYWVSALDDLLDRPAYGGAAEASLLLGLRFARDGITHGGTAAVVETGLAYPLSYPMDYGPLVWASPQLLLADWVPQGGNAISREAKRVAYSERVAGRRLLAPIAEAAGILRVEARLQFGI